jgi:hypothetical protein
MSYKGYKPKFGYDIRIKPAVSKKRPVTQKQCAAPGCREAGEVNVPKTRNNLDDRHWLCRDHLREHNRRWDFFANMSDADIERFCLDALTGHRPTWPLGKRAAAVPGSRPRDTAPGWTHQVDDGFAILDAGAESPQPKKASRLTKGQLDALALLNLEETATLHEIKARYKELVKRFHPDANGGNRGTEERLKQVIKAYSHLRATGLVAK